MQANDAIVVELSGFGGVYHSVVSLLLPERQHISVMPQFGGCNTHSRLPGGSSAGKVHFAHVGKRPQIELDAGVALILGGINCEHTRVAQLVLEVVEEHISVGLSIGGGGIESASTSSHLKVSFDSHIGIVENGPVSPAENIDILVRKLAFPLGDGIRFNRER